MKNRKLSSFTIVLFIICFALMQTAKASSIIDFSTILEGNITTIGDATFSLAGVGDSGDPIVEGDRLWNSSNERDTNTILRVDFSSVVSGLKFDFDPQGLKLFTNQGWTIYDDSLSVIASDAFTGEYRESYDLTAYTSISRIDFNNGGNTWYQGLYTIEYDASAPVPEPATVALLGIGLVGLAGAEVRRRRKKNGG